MTHLTVTGLVIGMWATGCATAPTSPVTGPLMAGDTAAVFEALKTEYASAGLIVDDTLPLFEQDALAPISTFRGTSILQSRFVAPGQGRDYWAMWSEVLTGKAWKPDDQLKDAAALDRAARWANMTTFAHEIGHHLNARYGAVGSTRALEELRADKLAVAMVNHLARVPELAAMRDVYRAQIDAALALVPAGNGTLPDADLDLVFADERFKLPSQPGAYAALHLARQRRLLDDPAHPTLQQLAGTIHFAARDQRLAARTLEPGWTLTTLEKDIRRPPGYWNAIASTDGSFWWFRHQSGPTRLELKPLLGAEPVVVVPLDGWSEIIPPPVLARYAVAARPPRGVSSAIVSGSDVIFQTAGLSWTARASLSGKTLALVDPGYRKGSANLVAADLVGGVWVAEARDVDETRRWFIEQLQADRAETVRTHVLDLRATGSGKPIVDGPIAQAVVDVQAFVVDAAGDITFVDGARAVRRVRDGRVVTLAGGLSGWRDGPNAEAELSTLENLTLTAEGDVLVVDRRTVNRDGKEAHAYGLRRLRRTGPPSAQGAEPAAPSSAASVAPTEAPSGASSDTVALSVSAAAPAAPANDLRVCMGCLTDGRCTRQGDRCVATSDTTCANSAACRSYGACFVRDGRCAMPGGETYCFAAPCKEAGLCDSVDGRCRATDDAQCRTSRACSSGGACWAVDGRCRPRSDADCAQFSGCEDGVGRCLVVGDRCGVGSDADCAQTKGCREEGACTAFDGNCMVGKPSDCDALCEVHGLCTALPWPASCSVRSDAECRQSTRCTEHGFCTAAFAECRQGSETDCRASEACARDGLCAWEGEGDRGRCVANDVGCRSSQVCAEAGRCTPKRGVCEATRDGDCEQARVCTERGLCAAGRKGACVADDDAACARSTQCRVAGQCARRALRLCMPTKERHCRESDICRDEGKCKLRKRRGDPNWCAPDRGR